MKTPAEFFYGTSFDKASGPKWASDIRRIPPIFGEIVSLRCANMKRTMFEALYCGRPKQAV